MSTTIPKEEQLAALLDGSALGLMERYAARVTHRFGDFFTVSHDELTHYLAAHPMEANALYENLVSQPIDAHDVCRIIPVERGYMVAWMDHGTPRDDVTFASRFEAVAARLLMELGLFRP